jgi:hypothetical protein
MLTLPLSIPLKTTYHTLIYPRATKLSYAKSPKNMNLTHSAKPRNFLNGRRPSNLSSKLFKPTTHGALSLYLKESTALAQNGSSKLNIRQMVP